MLRQDSFHYRRTETATQDRHQDLIMKLRGNLCVNDISNACSVWTSSSTFFFFFQAEDGIRDVAVTGVQTCALPISLCPARPPPPTVLNGAVRVLGLPSTTPPCGTFRQGSTSTDQRPCEISWRGHASVRGSVAASPIQARFASVHRYSCLARNVAARFPWRGGFRPRHPQNRGKRP